MKKLLPLACLLAVLCTGCAQRYVIITRNGTRISAQGKPSLKDGAYVFKDARGKKSTIPAVRVREISPENDSSQAGFTPGASQ